MEKVLVVMVTMMVQFLFLVGVPTDSTKGNSS